MPDGRRHLDAHTAGYRRQLRRLAHGGSAADCAEGGSLHDRCKIGHELRAERQKRKDKEKDKALSTAIVFLEQMYPFPDEELAAELERHGTARDIVWVQEEPANMGALSYMLPRLRHLGSDRPVHSVKRSGSASPATGSAKAHEVEQKTLLALAFATQD